MPASVIRRRVAGEVRRVVRTAQVDGVAAARRGEIKAKVGNRGFDGASNAAVAAALVRRFGGSTVENSRARA